MCLGYHEVARYGSRNIRHPGVKSLLFSLEGRTPPLMRPGRGMLVAERQAGGLAVAPRPLGLVTVSEGS